jgi:hypothetical protein
MLDGFSVGEMEMEGRGKRTLAFTAGFVNGVFGFVVFQCSNRHCGRRDMMMWGWSCLEAEAVKLYLGRSGAGVRGTLVLSPGSDSKAMSPLPSIHPHTEGICPRVIH